MSFPGYDLLSAEEKKCFLLMQQMKGNSLWFVAIKNVVEKPDSYRFRKLICQLKSQASDNPEVMKNILGENVMQAVVNL
ncbi:MAG: hypothetical protein ACJ749_11120 [Flavisolibacter sp.]